MDPWVGKLPWRREWQPTPVFLPGEFHGQRALIGYSPLGHKELDTTGHACTCLVKILLVDTMAGIWMSYQGTVLYFTDKEKKIRRGFNVPQIAELSDRTDF